jgi:hypothetical protein
MIIRNNLDYDRACKVAGTHPVKTAPNLVSVHSRPRTTTVVRPARVRPLLGGPPDNIRLGRQLQCGSSARRWCLRC